MKLFLKITSWFLPIYAIMMALINLCLPSYRDHVSPLVAITSWMQFYHGFSFVHDSNFSSIYNLMYGPLLYISHWPAFLLFGGSFFASKITGAALFCLSIYFLLHLSRQIKSDFHRWLFLIYFVIFSLGVEDFFYGNRADSFLFFLSMAGGFIFWSEKISEIKKLILLSVFMGLCLNYKIHSVLYLAPFVGALAVRGWRNLFISVGIFLITAAFPWIFLHKDLNLYVQILGGISKEMSFSNEGKQVLLLNFWTFVFFIGFWRIKFQEGYRALYIFSAVAIALVTLLASKMGSGMNQVIPLIPCYFVFFKTAETREIQSKYNWLIAVGLIDLLMSFTKSQGDMWHYYSGYQGLWARHAEIRELVKDLPNQSVFMGYSNKDYEDSFLRPELYFSNKGSLFIVDAVTLMENVHSNVPFSQTAFDNFLNCKAPYALIPNKGTPFELRSYYPPWPVIFENRWIEIFKVHYKVDRAGEYYSVWKCE